MAYPHEYYKLTFGGDIYNGQDEWSCGLNFGFPGQGVGWEEGDATEAMEEIATDISSYFVDDALKISLSANLKWVKLAFIGKDGLYFRDPLVYDYATPIAGVHNYYIAPQIALAVSFRSSKMRAPGKDARIFLPMVGLSPMADGKISPADALAVTLRTSTLITDLEKSLQYFEDDVPQLIVASQKTDVNNVVQTVRTGRLLDTQRRRRNKMQEEYSPSNVIVR